MGIGNVLMGDEGVGVHFAQMLEEEQLPAHVDILDGGTGGFHLMSYFEAYPCVILVDASLDDRPAGTIQLIKPRFSTDFPRAMSTHDIGLKDLVEGLTILGKLPEIYLFVVSIDAVQSQCLNLSSDIQKVLPELKKRVFDMIGKLT